MTSPIEPEAPHHAFAFTDTPPLAECAYCRSEFRKRLVKDEFGERTWVGRFCSTTCMKCYWMERREKKGL